MVSFFNLHFLHKKPYIYIYLSEFFPFSSNYFFEHAMVYFYKITTSKKRERHIRKGNFKGYINFTHNNTSMLVNILAHISSHEPTSKLINH